LTGGAYSIPEVQRLVATLVASKPGGRIAELGTSYGDGAKAIVAALPPGATFVTVELDPDRAARAREALAGTRAEVLEGDWRELLPERGPFDVLFADGGGSYGDVAELLGPGGILVKDDLTPGRPVDGDATREALLRDPRLEATEILVTAEMACIVAVRRTD
jgi:predicted O-methyltransferase YrrM